MVKYIASVKGTEFTIEIDQDQGIMIDGEPVEVDFRRLEAGGITSLLLDNRSIAATVEDRRDHWDVLIEGELYSVKVEDERAYRLNRQRGGELGADGEAVVTSPMPGIIVSVPVAEGDAVSFGDKVVILESMKMENELKAPCNGIVSQVNVGKGDSVEKDQPLVFITQAADEE